MSTGEAQRAHVRVRGRVQGVGFRFATADEARLRGATGWVRNVGYDEVEAVFEGPQGVVQVLVTWCREGPPGSWVRDVTVIWDEPPEGLAGFVIRPSAEGRGFR